MEALLALLESSATMVPGIADVRDAFVRDPKDEIILACLLEADVDVLITSDQDLLVLGNYRGTPIVSPRQFLDQYLSG